MTTPPASSPLQRFLVISLLTFTAYFPTLKVGFLWDDHVLIENNIHLRSWSLENIRHDFHEDVSDGKGDEFYYRPTHTWLNRLDYSVWKLNAMGYHLSSIFLLVGCALLLYELILIMGFSAWTAFLAVSLFAVHPIIVEGIMIVTGRATLLCTLFTFASLCLLQQSRIAYALAGLGCALLALLSKEQAVVLPGLLFVLDAMRPRWPKERLWHIGALCCIVIFYLLWRHIVFGTVGVPIHLEILARFFIKGFPMVLLHYVKLILIPWNLHSHRVVVGLSAWWPLVSAFCVFLWVYSFKHRHDRPLLFFSTYWLTINILPGLPVMIYGGLMLDHWGYVMLPAIVLPLGLFFDQQWQRHVHHKTGGWVLAYFPILIAWALLVHLNVALRGSDEKMFRWALHFTTSNPIKQNLGSILIETGRSSEAIPYLEEVRAQYPDDENNLYALAKAYALAGHPKTAKFLLKENLKRHPDHAQTRDTLAHITDR